MCMQNRRRNPNCSCECEEGYRREQGTLSDVEVNLRVDIGVCFMEVRQCEEEGNSAAGPHSLAYDPRPLEGWRRIGPPPAAVPHATI